MGIRYALIAANFPINKIEYFGRFAFIRKKKFLRKN